MARDTQMTPYGEFAADLAMNSLATLCDPENGIQTGPFGSQLHQKDYVLAGTPIITVEHLGENRIQHEDVPQVSDSDRDRLRRYQLLQGDIVFSRVGSVDRRALVRMAEEGWLFSGRCLRVRPDNSKIDSTYLSYFFGLREFKEHIRAIAVGATMPSLNTKILSDVVILHPSSLAEQRAIADILGTLDDKLESNRRMNETLETMVRAFFKSWFVDFDPVRARAEGRAPDLPKHISDLFPDSIEESELGEIPKGWRASVLGEEVKRCGGRIQTGPFGSQLHASDYVADGVPVVMPKDLSQRRVSTLSIARVKLSDAERLSRHRLQEGDIVYSRRGDVERHGLVRSRETGWLCGTGCLLVRLGEKWPSPLFASIALDRPETRTWIAQHAIGATMPNLNTGILARVPIVVPSDEVLYAFNRVVQPLADCVITNDARSETLVSLRDTLLPQLISGKLRVKDAVKIAVTA